MKYFKILILLTFFLLLSLQACSLVKKAAGADVDTEKLNESRKAKVLEIESTAAEKLYNRLINGDPPENSDISFYLSDELLTKIISQYNGSRGLFDKDTKYEIIGVFLKLQNGSAIATIFMNAHNNKYNVDLKLVMDCLLVFEIEKSDLFVKMEPFNIAPDVSAGGVLALTEEIISNLIKINLSQMSQKFPPIKIPVDFSNSFNIRKSEVNIKDKINLRIEVPARTINYKLTLKEVLIFRNSAFVALNFTNIEVK
ncbi:MAG: hypothetical protein NT007_01255 [Candidatus Kapabacteria bacterium]|nr:hypothetical protein [Candidatus Kapabacteria bacterium]